MTRSISQENAEDAEGFNPRIAFSALLRVLL